MLQETYSLLYATISEPMIEINSYLGTENIGNTKTYM